MGVRPPPAPLNRPTRITDTTATAIDHIWSNIISKPVINSGIITFKIADHLPIFQITKLGTVETKSQNRRKLSNLALKNLSTKLAQVDIFDILIDEDIDTATDKLYSHLTDAIDFVTPSSSSKHKSSKPLWYDKELRKLKTKKEAAYSKYIKVKNEITKASYLRAKNDFFHTLRSKRETLFQNLFFKHRKKRLLVLKNRW